MRFIIGDASLSLWWMKDAGDFDRMDKEKLRLRSFDPSPEEALRYREPLS
jgi:hypothetical protein